MTLFNFRMNAAAELRDAVNDQQSELDYMRRRESILSTTRTPIKSMPMDNRAEIFYHQQEIAELKEMVAALREDILQREQDPLQANYESVLEELSRAQDHMVAMQEDHEHVLREQANLHQQEMEDLHFEMQNLEAVVEDQKLELSSSHLVRQELEEVLKATEDDLGYMSREREATQLTVNVSAFSCLAPLLILETWTMMPL